MKLGPGDFRRFHQAVHGFEPFHWQQRLLEQVVKQRAWPAVLDIPTGAGKTTCLDIALFALALDAPNEERWAPRRIAMVVDRRVVVDQVAERGRRLASRLRDRGAPPVVREVATRLRSMTGADDEPLGVFTLRGGMPKDDGWARSPDQPLIIASTVDQLGSRLLMQGYGVSASMAPVHAGLLANDTLVLLDEVHLSQPFAETLEQLAALRERHAQGLASRFHTAFLSATPVGAGTKDFKLTKPELVADDLLEKRLAAAKRVSLREAADRQGVEKACLDASLELLERHHTIATVMNRVASATVVARRLSESLGPEADVVLLTGRMRPLDRDDALRELRGRIQSGRQRADGGRKLVVVATQCIEAGADFDFDALVTEAASLAALRQRFGRVDRLGEYGKAEGVIVHDSGEKDDPIYRNALATTWTWLERQLGGRKKRKGEQPTIDFGVLSLPVPDPSEAAELLAPQKHAPVLLPAYLDLWSQTNPQPSVVPDVGLFLHGPESGPADVQVVWRADVSQELLAAADEDPAERERLVARVAAIRPSSLEALSLPIGAARRWLGGAEAGEIADVEGVPSNENAEVGRSARAFRWRGGDSQVISAVDLRPGDTIVVPAAFGGLRAGCFDPRCRVAVADLAERAAMFGRGQAVLRVAPEVLGQFGLTGLWDFDEDEGIDRARLDEALRASSAEATLPPWRSVWFEHLVGGRLIPIGSDGRWLLLGERVTPEQVRRLAHEPEQETIELGAELTSDDEDSIFTGRPVPLLEHSKGVKTTALGFATRLGLPRALQGDLALAGWLHDVGKADRRFQVLLRGGDEIEYFKDETPWAKSGLPFAARAAQRRARELSGYPRGARHEIQSVAMLASPANVGQLKAHDLELVLHLVASHHGHCRALAPAVNDAKPVEVELRGFEGHDFAPTSSANGLHRLDSAVAERFWRLQRRIGWFELCWLEAVLRLADHRTSEEEQRRREPEGIR